MGEESRRYLHALPRSDSHQWDSESSVVNPATHFVLDDADRPLQYLISAIEEYEDGDQNNMYGDAFYGEQNGQTGYTDMQGIEWQSFEARQNYQSQRFAVHRPFHNVVHLQPNGEVGLKKLEKQFNAVYNPREELMLHFYRFSRQATPCHFHFQLRNLLASSSAFEYYYLERTLNTNKVMLYNAASDSSAAYLEFSSDKRSEVGKYKDILVSTLCYGEDLLLVGGFNGEMILSSTLNRDVASTRVDGTGHESNIVNAAEISRTASGALQLVLSTNCNSVCIYNPEDLSVARRIGLDWPANCSCACPEKPNLLAIVGDHTSGLLYDSAADARVATLTGHLDFCFAAAWHPNGTQFVTGSQDKSFRCWDMRNLSKAVDVLQCTHAEVRSLRYSPDGKYLAVAEPLDVVNVYDSRFQRKQALHLFGEFSGTAFSPDSSTLMLAVQDVHYGGLAEFVIEPTHALKDTYLPLEQAIRTTVNTEERVEGAVEDAQMVAV